MIGLCFLHSGFGWPERAGLDLPRRFATALDLGHGGSPEWATVEGAVLARRPRQPAGPQRAPRRGSLAPEISPTGELLLFDGRIDNRAEVIAALPGPVDPRLSDTALYGIAHACWGDDCDLRIVGTYASILWDTDWREARLATSPITAPPLHIWHDGEMAIVASLPQAIFACGVERRLDEQKLADTLFLNYNEGTRGWFEGLHRLQPGMRGRLSRAGLALRTYWDIASLPPVRLRRDEDYVEAIDDLFRQSTRATLHGFERPAVSLSGGLDSQAVATYALDEVGPNGRLLGLTAVPEPGWDGIPNGKGFGDESDHVRALAAMHDRLDIEYVDAAGLGFDYKTEAMFLLANGAPRNATNLHWIHRIRERAQQSACDVILTATRGNISFSFDGLSALPDWLLRGNWLRLVRELRVLKHDARPVWRRFAGHAARPLLPRRINAAVSRYRQGRPGNREPDWSPLHPEWANTMRVHERAAEMAFDPHFNPPRSTREWRSLVMGNAANEASDVHQAMALLHGLPMRDPTAWRPLMEFCAGIPDDQYLRDGQTRWLARRLLKGRVPEMVRTENRRGVQAADWPQRLWRGREALTAELERLANDPAMAARFDLPRLRAALDTWDGKRPGHGTPELNLLQAALPRALTTARFIRFIEGRNTA
jgi:asparagine synthase (glutamine-hydrolysing)